MRLLTFQHQGNIRLGVLNHEGAVVDVSAVDASKAFASMQNLIDAGPEPLQRLRQISRNSRYVLDAGSVQWLSPLPQPAQMRDFIVFEEHMRMAGWRGAQLRELWGAAPAPAEPMPVPKIWYEQPIYYKCNRFAASGHETRVCWPRNSHIADYELEIACVIGKTGKDISAQNAVAHIFGLTIFNDLTARDLQFREMQGPLGPAKGKDFDGANVLGPVIVTADEFEWPLSLEMTARVNGQVWSSGRSSEMHWSFPDIVAYASASETLYPGEILGSGTVGGGCGLELGRFLKHDDVVSLEVEGIGILTAHIDAPHIVERMTL